MDTTEARGQRFSVSGAAAAGAIAGAALMFLLDPAQGRARRARLRDQTARFGRRSWRFVEGASVDLANRSWGAARRIASHDDTEVVSDDVLVARIRSAIGRLVSHPGAVHVMIDNGAVRLDGPILMEEIRPVLDAVRRVAGDRLIHNNLRVGKRDGHVPGLQGEGTAPRGRLRHRLGSPGVRALLVTSSGLAMIAASRYLRSSEAQATSGPALHV